MTETTNEPAAELTLNLERIQADVRAFDKIAAGIERLHREHPVNLVLDLTSPKGMQQAIAARAAYRGPRTEVERVRKSVKAPILAAGRAIDAMAAQIEEQLRIGESNYHDQIKVEEERKARAKAEAEEKERDRIAAIQAKIAFNFSSVPMRFASKSAADLMSAMHTVSLADISEATYAERSQDAIEAKTRALSELQVLHKAAQEREAESERLRLAAEEHMRKAAELAQQQADFEESKRAERQRIVDEANAREAQQRAEKAARDAELAALQKAREDLAAVQRAEADRLAAIERKRLDNEAAAERERQQAKFLKEQQDRLEEEARANDLRERQRQADAAEQKRKDAAAARALKKAQKQAALAPRLLSVLVDLLAQLDQADSPDGGDIKQYEAAKRRARALITEAEEE